MLAADRGGAVVISPGAGKGTRPVIMQIAEPRDMQAMDVVVVPVMMPAKRIVGGLRGERGGDQHA